MYFVFAIASLLIHSSYSAYLTCLDGGAGPCLGVLCPDPVNFACIHTSDLDPGTCCDFAQISNPKAPVVAPTTAAPTTTTTTQLTTTTTSTCVDKLNPLTGVSDCPKFPFLCNDPKYYAFMTEQCPKTCNRCDEALRSTPPSTCQDKVNPVTGYSDCPKNAYLCRNPTYLQLMQEQCPKTCGYCI